MRTVPAIHAHVASSPTPGSPRREDREYFLDGLRMAVGVTRGEVANR
jgi:hypothetical protein